MSWARHPNKVAMLHFSAFFPNLTRMNWWYTYLCQARRYCYAFGLNLKLNKCTLNPVMGNTLSLLWHCGWKNSWWAGWWRRGKQYTQTFWKLMCSMYNLHNASFAKAVNWIYVQNMFYSSPKWWNMNSNWQTFIINMHYSYSS